MRPCGCSPRDRRDSPSSQVTQALQQRLIGGYEEGAGGFGSGCVQHVVDRVVAIPTPHFPRSPDMSAITDRLDRQRRQDAVCGVRRGPAPSTSPDPSGKGARTTRRRAVQFVLAGQAAEGGHRG